MITVIDIDGEQSVCIKQKKKKKQLLKVVHRRALTSEWFHVNHHETCILSGGLLLDG